MRFIRLELLHECVVHTIAINWYTTIIELFRSCNSSRNHRCEYTHLVQYDHLANSSCNNSRLINSGVNGPLHGIWKHQQKLLRFYASREIIFIIFQYSKHK